MPKIYRVICYDGPDEWLERQLDKSIHGVRQFTKVAQDGTKLNDCTITVATIDPEDALSIEIARNKLFSPIATIVAQPKYGTLFETLEHFENFGRIRLEIDAERLALWWGGQIRYKFQGFPII